MQAAEPLLKETALQIVEPLTLSVKVTVPSGTVLTVDQVTTTDAVKVTGSSKNEGVKEVTTVVVVG